jgi:hypothetical protein
MRQLPVLAAFGHTVRSTLNNLKFAFHISWPWMLVLLPFNVAGNIYTTLNYTPSPAPTEAFAMPPADVLAVIIGIGALAFVSFGSIAVSWHRYILRDEVPVGLARFRLDKVVWRYVGNAIAITIVATVVGGLVMLPFALAASLPLMTGTVGLVLAVPIFAAGAVCAIAVSMRLGIKLPAVAMDDHSVTLATAWNLTRDNHWRCGALLALVVLCLLGVGLVFAVLTSAFSGSVTSVAIVTLVIVQMAVNWVSTIWNVTVLTSLYGFFVEQREF